MKKIIATLLALVLLGATGCGDNGGSSVASFKKVSSPQLTKWRTMTDERIDEICNSPNMEIPEGATVYYISQNGSDYNDGKTPETPWCSLYMLDRYLPKGSYVCFERGGVWRGTLAVRSGVTYTAYGEGEKPKLYASPKNYADAAYWEQTDAENIWSLHIGTNDVGTLVFNEGEQHAVKCVIRTEADGTTYNNTTGEPFASYADLTTDLHFYHEYQSSGILYLYSEQNPGERFTSIECNVKQHIISVGDTADVTIDNLCLKYTGAHGISAVGDSVSNLTVQNCEFGWIGGSIQQEGIFGRNYGTRYGNAIEIYGGCDGVTVTNNYIYQVYDAGITQQYTLSSAEQEIYQRNMRYAHNVIEYCNYSIEYFLSNCPSENPSCMENFVIEDNYMWYAGEGFCEQRPDKGQGSHINGWSGTNNNRAANYVIRDNLMLYSKQILVWIASNLRNPDGSDSMPVMSGNHYLQTKGSSFGMAAQDAEGWQVYDENIPAYLGDKSTGDMFWYEK